ncbi:MAG: branched-chain amino acid ABC transporter permease [Alphaproteobacteria bacterium]|nr:branched-chain amino acid ABC transporter permease [Alphaproteobacteria bacterium]MCA0449425.1 branched-chain amino acid ABC transporter permease [Pseudomonadota bacterium]
MIGQALADGILTGGILALGAIGYSLSVKILKFANFAHAEFLSVGAYLALTLAALMGAGTPIDPLSFGLPLIAATIIAGVATGVIAILVDTLVFSRLRARRAAALTLVFASFGMALILRNLVLLLWGPNAHYYGQELQIAIEVLPDVRMLPDHVFVLVLTILLVLSLHFFLQTSRVGVAMRAMADSPALSQACGIDTASVIRWTWLLAGMLAACAGVFAGLTVQIRPELGFNMLLAVLTAAVLGGAGNLFGAVVGGLVVGLAESLSVLIIPASFKPAIPFLLLLIVLYVRPQGLFTKSVRA